MRHENFSCILASLGVKIQYEFDYNGFEKSSVKLEEGETIELRKYLDERTSTYGNTTNNQTATLAMLGQPQLNSANYGDFLATFPQISPLSFWGQMSNGKSQHGC